MLLNRLKNRFATLLRKCIVNYYRTLGVEVGRGVFISHKAKIDTTYSRSLVIEDNCFITYGAIILAHDHSVYRHTPLAIDDGRGKVHLKRNVFVGAGAIILRNVTIGENSVIAAGSVVTEDVPPNVIVAGNPAQIVKTMDLPI